MEQARGWFAAGIDAVSAANDRHDDLATRHDALTTAFEVHRSEATVHRASRRARSR